MVPFENPKIIHGVLRREDFLRYGLSPEVRQRTRGKEGYGDRGAENRL